jgi:hypothetical protein
VRKTAIRIVWDDETLRAALRRPTIFMKTKKLQTIDEYFGLPKHSFKKYIEKQEAELRKSEDERKARIRNCKK